jgi:CHAT domain-containing protein
MEIEANFKKVSPDEEMRLREVLAAPLNKDALKANLEIQINEKRMAAKKLAMHDAEEAVLLEAKTLVNNPGVVNDLANIARNRGDYAKAVGLHQEAVEIAPKQRKPFFMVHVANDYLRWGRLGQARKELDKIFPDIEALDRERWGLGDQIMLKRSEQFAYFVLSLLEQRLGKWDKSIEAANLSEKAARKALSLTSSRNNSFEKLNVAADLANALSRKVQAYRAAARFADAEQALRDYLRFSSEVELPAHFRSGMYIVAANLRFAQREFEQSERLARKSDEILEGLGFDALRTDRTERRRDLFIALAGQKKWQQAKAEIERLDGLANGNAAAASRIAFNFDRAYVYLGNKEPALAAPLFERVAAANVKTFGEGHYFSAQAQGLQGVALWQQGGQEQKQKALQLLKSSVNLDYLDQVGIRPEIRQLIIGAYIEAAAELDPQSVLQALGLADWLRAGAVQEALTDAAVRSAANTQGLAELVRQEQDAKNEIRAVRAYLSGDAGNARSTLPEAAAQMRERINQLEKERVQYQTQIKASFPDYERLVRPLPPNLDEIAKKLTKNEALLVVMPDASGVNVWAVKQVDGKPQAKFHRAPLTEAQISRNVDVLRQSLDSLGTQGRLLPFDDRLAQETYKVLIAPLEDVLNDRSEWIVAASGSLARLPFAVLQTSAKRNGATRDWLIQKASLTQVPSVSSWVSLRGLTRRKLPEQSLIAWGDPVFDPAVNRALGNGTVRKVNFTRAAKSDIEAEELNGAKMYHSMPPLPETRDELQDLAKALRADTANDLFMGLKATRESVLKANASGLLSNKKVIVFATHGLMAGDLPKLLEPALALSADGSELKNALSPLLTLEDVLGLKLNADWVVLSACNTAAADGKGEEALSGLARGFFYAGGRSLLVTHWAVESNSAKELTTRTFMHFTQHPNAPKSESLREAMLQVMADTRYSHPAFWAPYALVGDALR